MEVEREGCNRPDRSKRESLAEDLLTAAGSDMREKIREAIKLIAEGMIERDEVAMLIVLAVLAGEHLFMYGPPGTAKSFISRRILRVFTVNHMFSHLLTSYTIPDELFGPISLQLLEKDQYKRITTKYLPSADVAFLDEIFKAGKGILNALLMILNEREFINDGESERVPLHTMIAASNELPSTSSLHAIYDRLLLRVRMEPVSKTHLASLLQNNFDDSNNACLGISLIDAKRLKKCSSSMLIPNDVIVFLEKLRAKIEDLESEKLNWRGNTGGEKTSVCSDRRWRKCGELLKLAAYTNHSTCAQVQLADCYVLLYALWDTVVFFERLKEWMLIALRVEFGESEHESAQLQYIRDSLWITTKEREVLLRPVTEEEKEKLFGEAKLMKEKRLAIEQEEKLRSDACRRKEANDAMERLQAATLSKIEEESREKHLKAQMQNNLENQKIEAEKKQLEQEREWHELTEKRNKVNAERNEERRRGEEQRQQAAERKNFANQATLELKEIRDSMILHGSGTWAYAKKFSDDEQKELWQKINPLLEKGANINHKYRWGETLLSQCIWSGYSILLSYVIQQPAVEEEAFIPDHRGYYLIHNAVLFHFDNPSLLLQLCTSILERFPHLIYYSIDRDLNFKRESEGADGVTHKRYEGDTAFMIIARKCEIYQLGVESYRSVLELMLKTSIDHPKPNCTPEGLLSRDSADGKTFIDLGYKLFGKSAAWLDWKRKKLIA